MNRWTVEQADRWYRAQPWLVGCNFLPSTAVNQLEMWQAGTYDPTTIDRELGWAEDLGFNALRVYLHDLLWSSDRKAFAARIDDFLGRASAHGMRVILVLFDDCHRPDPELGPQPLPVRGVHNSGWNQSPGQRLVRQFHDGTVVHGERARLRDYVHGVLTQFADDDRVLLWDLYNEPGRSGNGDDANELLAATWQWAQAARPSQPLTSCLDGSVGQQNIALNAVNSDLITFHAYDGDTLEETILKYQASPAARPVICTEYLARELGSTFQRCLPIFKAHRVGCFNWGLVAGRSQTHFNWQTVEKMAELKARGCLLKPSDPIPEPPVWFHDIFRADGTPFAQAEVDFIKRVTQPESNHRVGPPR